MGISEKCKEVLSNYDIMKNSDISDSILPNWQYEQDGEQHKYFININTGVISDDIKNVIRDNKKHIRINKGSYGYLVKYFSEYDCLLVVLYHLSAANNSFKWKEKIRFIVGRDESISIRNGEFGQAQEYLIHDIAVDLCGQYIDDTLNETNIEKTAWEESYKFFGGALWQQQNLYTARLNLQAIYAFIDFQKEENKITSGIKEYFMDGKILPELEIPYEQRKKIESVVKQNIDYCRQMGFVSNNQFIRGFSFGILKNYDGEYFFRNIVTQVDEVDNSGEAFKMRYYEIERTRMCDKVLDDMYMLRTPLLYFDRNGIEDSDFKYVINLLEEAENKTAKALEILNTTRLFNNADCTIKIAAAAAYMPFYEKLYKFFSSIKTENMEEEIKRLSNISYIRRLPNNNSFKLMLTYEFGSVEFDKKELHQCLKIPKTAVKILAKQSDFAQSVKTLKTIFDDSMDYLNSMNSDDIRMVIDFIKKFIIYENTNYAIYICLKTLIRIFGPYNISGYCSFLQDMCNEKYAEISGMDEISFYNHYLSKLEVLKSVTSDLQWKLRGEALEKADEAITPAYSLIKDKDKDAELLEEYQNLNKAWKKYEYEKDDFFITYPKAPSDVIEEGIKLNNCVKEFVFDIAEKKTTLLFIRKKERPLKPFFTMEIVDERVRQCHGNSNSNICSIKGLKEFIDGFCKKNEIKVDFIEIDNALGPLEAPYTW